MALGGTSSLFLIGFAVATTGLVLHIIGVATNKWAVGVVLHNTFGLWKNCLADSCYKVENPSSKREACQAFAIIGLIAAGGGVLLALLQIVISMAGKSAPRIFPFLISSACFTAGVAIFICIVVWGATIQDENKRLYDVGYSYILSIIADALISAGGFMLYLGGKS
ncbi:hypothetical protein Btru_076502 [Bulinus truncatus]|nr:hypothetical protein Btru_076502 [Bulinus truncatus]